MDATQIPLQVVARSMIAHGGTMVAQVHIGWSGLAPDLTTSLSRRTCLGQAGSKGKGDVSTIVYAKAGPPRHEAKSGKRERSRRLSRVNVRAGMDYEAVDS